MKVAESRDRNIPITLHLNGESLTVYHGFDWGPHADTSIVEYLNWVRAWAFTETSPEWADGDPSNRPKICSFSVSAHALTPDLRRWLGVL